MSFVLWQLADFGVTIGYHRLYSHRAFQASLPVRVVLVALGSSASQGSIKVRCRCLRHRLHHVRFFFHLIKYAATRGLLYSHMGWIFFKPKYERINAVDQEDLDSDPRNMPSGFSVPIAFILGYVVPVSLGYSWGDPVGAFIYGGLVTRLASDQAIDSLAHWNGLQPYSDEDTSKSNLLLAILTCGEGNHNFHAFPQDYRSGPSKLDWDPSKWIIDGLHYLGLVTSIRRARPEDIDEARDYMRQKALGEKITSTKADESWSGKEWTIKETQEYAASNPARCLVVVDGFVVDVTEYLKEHPGGAKLLRGYAIQTEQDGQSWRDASWAFGGGLNNHSRAAKRRMCGLRKRSKLFVLIASNLILAHHMFVWRRDLRVQSKTNITKYPTFGIALMAENFDLEELVHLEQTFYDAGYTDGFDHGRIHGLIEGRALGREKGFEIWEEIGFYEGFASTWQAIYAQRGQEDQRAVRHIKHLLDLIRQFPTVNPSAQSHHSSEDEIDLSKLQRQIRSRYKALCASLGVRPTLRAGSGNEDAGEGRVVADGTHPSLRNASAKRDVWTLEGDVKRPTMQGLSF
ncbi:hypothetical protein J3R83DRAFT_6080 [Lanmaoa asiatica]|nr:hypothetical protein J3R83DRAFT_6080 [Lanmaoa asiatica]